MIRVFLELSFALLLFVILSVKVVWRSERPAWWKVIWTFFLALLVLVFVLPDEYFMVLFVMIHGLF